MSEAPEVDQPANPTPASTDPSPAARPASTAGPQAARPPAPRPRTEPALTGGQVAILVGLVALTVVGIVLYSQERSIEDLTRAVGQIQQRLASQAGASPAWAGADIDVTGAPALGPVDDVVTLIEFSDYECPFCIKHFTTTMPQIQAAYIATGKIRYVFKDFPIDENHPMSIRAHEAAHCAMEQDKFWALHVKLFSAPGTHTPDQLQARAAEAGLDLPAFKACIASGRTTAAVRASAAIADKLGADGTPTFYFGKRDLATNHVRVEKMIDGAQPFSAFQSALDDLLK